MSDDYGDLESVLMQGTTSRKWRLFELHRDARENHREVDGFHIHDFLRLNELAGKDLSRYCSVLERTSYVSTAYTLISILLGSWMSRPLVVDFEQFVSAAGERCLQLLIKSLVENFCNPRDINQDNESLMYLLLDVRNDLRSVLLLGIASEIIYETCGALEQGKHEGDASETIRGRKIRLLKNIITKYNSDILRITESDIREFFGYEDKWIDEDYRNARDSGKLLGFNEGCAAALMVIRQFDISISKSELSKLITGSFYFNSLASVWKINAQNVLSVYLADSLVDQCDEQTILNFVRGESVNVLYRYSHSYYLGNSESTRAVEMYLWMLPDLVARLLDNGDIALAQKVFDRGWDDCRTALYGWVLPNVPVHVIQLLFYYRVFKLAKYIGDGFAMLLKDLPQVCMANGQWVQIADVCLGTIRRHCQDVKTLKDISPEICDLLVNQRAEADS